MFKSGAFFNSKKTTRRPFKDYYIEWFNTLKTTLLPQLRHSLSSTTTTTLLSIHVEMLHNHFQSYYHALDLATTVEDLPHLLYPPWRNSLEKPFLWLGDFHPYIFTNLLRSFLDTQETDEEEDDDESGNESVVNFRKKPELFNKPWDVVTAWRSPSKSLTSKIEQIECGLRLMVPALVERGRHVQAEFVERVGAEWGRWKGRKESGEKMAVGEAVVAEMEEMMSVFLDANRLRRSVLTEILNVTNVYQAALFLEGLSQFIVGLRDHEFFREFERCKMPIN